MSAEKRFPELAAFDLEMESLTGGWSTFRANEDERAACVLENDDAIRLMLCGAYAVVEKDGTRTRFRLTPKSWRATS